MKITLYRYLLKEQAAPLTVCFLGLTAVLVTARLLQLTRYLFTSSLTLLDVAEVMAYAIPKLILFALPMATLIGVLLAFLRLNSDNELIVLRAAGLSFKQFLPPILGVVLLTTVVALFNSIYVMPPANVAFDYKLKTVRRASIPVFLKDGTFIDAIPNLVFFFQSVNPSELSMKGIFIQDQRQPGMRLAIVAEHAQIEYDRTFSHLIFRISNGIITRIPDTLKDAQAIGFKAYELSLSLDELFPLSLDSKNKRTMSLSELYATIFRKTGKSTIAYSMELNQRLALPFSCMVLGLIGAPLGALFRQRSRMTGITLGLLIYLAYYVILSAGKGLGENGILPAGLVTWIPNFFALIIAVFLWRKTQLETSFGLASLWKYLQPLMKSIRNIFRLRTEEPNP
ncbi:MAG: LPS export ABC transporter permease LptF [Syntrophobacteraceae bacterium]